MIATIFTIAALVCFIAASFPRSLFDTRVNLVPLGLACLTLAMLVGGSAIF